MGLNNSQKRSILVIGVAIAFLATLGAYSVGSLNQAKAAQVTQTGDFVRIEVAFYDEGARMLLSTKTEDLPQIESVAANWTFGRFVVPPDDLNAFVYEIKDVVEPAPITRTSSVIVGHAFTGVPVGTKIGFPVVGTFEGYTSNLTLDRVRGPFNLTLTVPTADLEQFASNISDDLFEIDSVLTGRILTEEKGNSTVALSLNDGQMLPVRQAGFEAEVHILPDGKTFTLTLSTEVGHEFSLVKTCAFARYVLPPGSYRVVSVNETSIHLDQSPTKFPQLMGRPLSTTLELIEIIELASSGR